MSEIQPIDDAYIDSIIKAVGSYNPSLNKTQGVQFRELIKLLRDYSEQIGDGLIQQSELVQTYTAMIAKGIPATVKTYRIITDEKRNLTNSVYEWWPNGKIFFIKSVLDAEIDPLPIPNETVAVRVYITATDLTLYQSADFLGAVNFLNTTGITEDTTFEVNSNSTILLADQIQLAVNNNNGAFKLDFKGAQDKNVVIDGQNSLPTLLLISMDNCTVSNLTFKNGDLAADNGCLIRADSTRNVSILGVNFKRGYCAVRASENVYDLLIEGATVAEVSNGSFRIGNGLSTGIDRLYDTRNVTLRNISFLNSATDALIPGTTTVNSPYFFLKRGNNVTVEALKYDQQIQSGMGNIEESHQVVFDGVVANATLANGLFLLNNTEVTISNYFFKPMSGLSSGTFALYGSNTGQIKIYHCTLLIAQDVDTSLYLGDTYQVTLEGNIFQSTRYDGAGASLAFKNSEGYVATLANDLLSEKSNVFLAKEDWSIYLSLQFLSDINNGEYTKLFTHNETFTPSIWQSTYNRGQGSVYVNDFALLNFTDGLHLATTSVGKDIVTTKIADVSKDAYGSGRIFPTDAGAFES